MDLLDELDKSYPKDCKDIKQSINFEQQGTGLYVVAIAISKHDSNRDIQISTKYGVCLCNELHDHVKDCYHVYAVDYFEIGRIPVNYVITITGIDSWYADIPLPMSVLKRHMTLSQKRHFNAWKMNYPDSDYVITFLQILNVYKY
jgi:hypothetical protein